jgi:hypothetical protein
MDKKPEWIDLVNEALGEVFLAVLYVLSFIIIGIISIYFIDTVYIKDFVMGTISILGVLSLMKYISKKLEG